MSDRPSRQPLPGNPRICVSEAPARNHSTPSSHSIPSRSIEAELVALDVLHHEARLVLFVGEQQLIT